METIPIVFIQGSFSKGSQKDQDIARFKAKSHAAKTAHQRRRNENSKKSGGLTVIPWAIDQHKNKLQTVTSGRSNLPDQEEIESDTTQPIIENTILLATLYKGNSDPFKALSAEITPRGSYIISFFRDVFQPSAYRSEVSTASIRQSALVDEWNHISNALQVECCLHGLMLAFLTVIAKLSPRDAYSKDLLALKANSIRSLRHRMQENLSGDLALAHGILFLYTADLFGGNFDEANIHRHMLQAMLDQASKMKAVMSADHGFMVRLMWLDLQSALSQMSATSFNVNRWTDHMESPDLLAVSKVLQPIGAGLAQEMAEIFQIEPLRSIYIQFRHAAVIWLSQDLYLQSMGSLVAMWVQGWSQINSAKALKHYLYLRMFLLDSGTMEAKKVLQDGQEFSWAIQCCVVLTMLLVVGQAGNECLVAGNPVFPAYLMVYNELQNIMEVLCRWVDHEIGSHKQQDLFLWALFTGAQYERRCLRVFRAPSNAWFNRNFRLHKKKMGLSSWPAVKEMLMRFLFVDEVEPNGKHWV